METNIDTDVGNNAPPQDTGRFDDRSSDRTSDRGDRFGRDDRRSVRDELRAQFDDARSREPEEPIEHDRIRDRDREREIFPEGRQTEREAPVQVTQQDQQTQTQAPNAWAKEARDIWSQVPPQAQAAIIKREQDVERGVAHLRSQYGEIEQAIAPFDDQIRGFGKTRGQAVAQLFMWFDALSRNPDQAFPALLRSYSYDPRRLAAFYGMQMQPQQPPTPEQQEEHQRRMQQQQVQQRQQQQFQQYLNNQMQQYLAPVYHQMQEQQTAKTHEMLEMWSRDKPHFEKVRVLMGHLLTPDPNTGQSAVPLTADGKVDLDGAYEAAVHMVPELRQTLMQDEINRLETARKAEEAKKAKVRMEQVDRARRAGNSLTSSSPGSPPTRSTKAASKGKSVRDSIMDSIAEFRGQ